MATGISKKTDQPASNLDACAAQLGANFTKAQDDLLKAYKLKEGASAQDLKKVADALGVKVSDASVRSLQLIAEQRFQHGSHAINMFSSLIDKVDQLKQRLISKFSN